MKLFGHQGLIQIRQSGCYACKMDRLYPANGGKDMMHEWWEGWGPGGWGGMWFGPVIWLALLALLVIGIASFWRRSANRDETAGPHSPTPRQILNERFAKGEID
jgi:uncharacterized membrane protein